MKLLYITNQICGSGGLERVLSIKASYLADKLGYNVHVVTLNQNDAPLFYKFSDKLKYHDITVNGNYLQYFIKYRNCLKSIINTIQPDIISVCDDGLKGFFVPKIIHKPCIMIYERHASKNIFKKTDTPNILQKIKYKVIDIMMHYGAKNYDAFVVLTNYNTNEWKLDNLTVIANPLSFYPNTLSNGNNKKVITVGNHGYQKGLDRLLQIWERVSDKFPEWKLDVYGKIDKNETYIALAKKLNIDNSVNFHNPVKNIGDKYQEASIYAMTSRSEGFGMVLIEGMAYGLPCISFDCPSGPRDIITDKESGFLILNGDIETYTDKLILLIENNLLRLQMGKKAREKAKKYLPENIVPQWHDLFLSLIKLKL
ncbi:MAG: glycosyltransferase family 4 protein [Flavobacteriaceae bacterium]|nr:glycosyltransferase family 4 protein [Flavobacteriaceae bacterium]